MHLGRTREIASARSELQWFQDAKLGIFIHWGIYSVNGVDESWSLLQQEDQGPGVHETTRAASRRATTIPLAWAELIKRSGAKYAVITTKHHDGVAMYDTMLPIGSLVTWGPLASSQRDGVEMPTSSARSTPAIQDVVSPFFKELRSSRGEMRRVLLV